MSCLISSWSPACGCAPAPPLHNPDEHVTPVLGSTVWLPPPPGKGQATKTALKALHSLISSAPSVSLMPLSHSLHIPAHLNYLLLPTLPGCCNSLCLCSAFLSVLMVLPHLIPWLFSHSPTSTQSLAPSQWLLQAGL